MGLPLRPRRARGARHQSGTVDGVADPQGRRDRPGARRDGPGASEQAAVQPGCKVTTVLLSGPVQNGRSRGIEQVIGVGVGEGLGLIPGPGADPVVQDLDQAVVLPLASVGAACCLCAARTYGLEKVKVNAIPGAHARATAAETFRRLYWDTALSWGDPVLRMLRDFVRLRLPLPAAGPGRLVPRAHRGQPGTYRKRANGRPRRDGDEADPAAGQPAAPDSTTRVMTRLDSPGDRRASGRRRHGGGRASRRRVRGLSTR